MENVSPWTHFELTINLWRILFIHLYMKCVRFKVGHFYLYYIYISAEWAFYEVRGKIFLQSPKWSWEREKGGAWLALYTQKNSLIWHLYMYIFINTLPESSLLPCIIAAASHLKSSVKFVEHICIIASRIVININLQYTLRLTSFFKARTFERIFNCTQVLFLPSAIANNCDYHQQFMLE